MSFDQWKILTKLSRQDRLTQKQIPERLEVEDPTLVPIIDKIEKKGFEKRKVDHVWTWKSMADCSMQVRKSSIKDRNYGTCPGKDIAEPSMGLAKNDA